MLVTEEVGNRVEINGAVCEVVTRQFAAGVFEHLLKGDPRIRQPPLQGACAGAHFPGGVLKSRALAGQGAFEGTLDLIAYICGGVALLKLGFQVGPNRREQFLVVGDEGQVQVTVAKDQRVAAGVESHGAAEVGFEQRTAANRTSQFQAQRLNAAVGALASDA